MIDYEAEEVVKHIFSRLRCVYDRRKAALLAFLAQYKVGRRNVYELMCGGRPLARQSEVLHRLWRHERRGI